MSELGELVRFIATRLIDKPETIQIVEESDGATNRIKLILPSEELGKVIGRQGRIARAMRVILNLAASKLKQHAYLDIQG
jgi:predicted RNA-binding protein YlqC (UPF0109 family)